MEAALGEGHLILNKERGELSLNLSNNSIFYIAHERKHLARLWEFSYVWRTCSQRRKNCHRLHFEHLLPLPKQYFVFHQVNNLLPNIVRRDHREECKTVGGTLKTRDHLKLGIVAGSKHSALVFMRLIFDTSYYTRIC